jgi:hypothetical protein
VAQGVAARHNAGWLRLVWVKGQYERGRWSSDGIRSHASASSAIPIVTRPSGWGFSRTLPSDRMAHELHLDIDSYAGTELTAYHGDPEAVAHLTT